MLRRYRCTTSPHPRVYRISMMISWITLLYFATVVSANGIIQVVNLHAASEVLSETLQQQQQQQSHQVLRKKARVDSLQEPPSVPSESLKGATTARRYEQELIIDDNSNAASAFLKCYTLMEEIASTTGGMNQQDYVEFLKLMTEGDINVDRFDQLASIYIMIFYTAACTTENDCIDPNVARIEIGTTEDPPGDLQLFCKSILKNTQTVADAAFEYSIRYNPTTLEEEALATCLAGASVNVLVERLANCTVVGEDRRRIQEWNLQLPNGQSWNRFEIDQHNRILQALGSADSGENDDCEYNIQVTVDRITDSGKFN